MKGGSRRLRKVKRRLRSVKRRLTPRRNACKVSVIVPVYNPGDRIDALLVSLDAQTLPRTEWEAIFIDDGSTDGTGARLDALAVDHPHYVVRHIPNSGWPGTPRNVGLDLARGEYVAFVDHDDYLGVRALEFVFEFATRHGSDIVVAREVGVGRDIGRFVFRHTIPDAKLDRDPVMKLLTPHKVYRRSMLRKNHIRFPEGKVRLEDHQFNVQAFFAASRLSIFADYPCYYWTYREDAPHASSGPPDLREYFDVAINNVLDLVDHHTEPGPYRDQIKSYWLDKKMLRNLSGLTMLEYSAAEREAAFSTIRRIALTRFTADTTSYLELPMRVRAHLLRTKRLGDMLALAHAEYGITTNISTRRVWWNGTDAAIHLVMELRYQDGSPVQFRKELGRVLWEPPIALPREVITDPVTDVTVELANAQVHVVVKRRDAFEDYSVRAAGTVQLVPSGQGLWKIVYDGEARVPLRVLRSLSDGPGRYIVDLSAELEAVGWRSTRRLPVPPPQRDGEPFPDQSDKGAVSFYTTKMGNLSIRCHPEVAPGTSAGRK